MVESEEVIRLQKFQNQIWKGETGELWPKRENLGESTVFWEVWIAAQETHHLGYTSLARHPGEEKKEIICFLILETDGYCQISKAFVKIRG